MSYEVADPLMTRREAAAFLGVSVRWLELAAWRADGPGYFKIGGHVRYRRSELTQWLEAQRVEPIVATRRGAA